MNMLRWGISGFLGAVWLFCAGANARLAWRAYVKKEPDVPSLIPLLGGVCAYLAVLCAPVDLGFYEFLLFISMAVLDCGSGPYLFITAWMLFKKRNELG